MRLLGIRVRQSILGVASPHRPGMTPACRRVQRARRDCVIRDRTQLPSSRRDRLAVQSRTTRPVEVKPVSAMLTRNSFVLVQVRELSFRCLCLNSAACLCVFITVAVPLAKSNTLSQQMPFLLKSFVVHSCDLQPEDT